MDFLVIDFETVATLLLLLLIGIGPKIALVPFLEKTKKFTPEQQVAIGRRMVITAMVAAVVVFVSGGVLLRLLHITTGAVAVADGIILALIAVKMALGSEEVVEGHEAPSDPDKLAVYPLAIPYLFNPVGMTVLIIASDSVHSIAAAALVLGCLIRPPTPRMVQWRGCLPRRQPLEQPGCASGLLRNRSRHGHAHSCRVQAFSRARHHMKSCWHMVDLEKFGDAPIYEEGVGTGAATRRCSYQN